MNTLLHCHIVKPALIDMIREHGATSVFKDWKGSDEDAIRNLFTDTYYYAPVAHCDNRDEEGRCLGHREGDK